MARIALAGFHHETNTFSPSKTTWDDFVRAEEFPGLTEGADMLTVFPPLNIGSGGFIKEAKQRGFDLCPIAWCYAVPAAHVTTDAFERMSALIVGGLRSLGPIDGVYLDLHGAMVTEDHEDAEGEIIRRVRSVVGAEMPLAVSLDLHANMTSDIIELADCVIVYRTYPHLDMADTGRQAAVILDSLLTGRRWAKRRLELPFLIPLTGQCTMIEPMKSVYGLLGQIETRDGVYSMSFAPGFPPADIRDCGPAIVAYGDTQEAADGAAQDLFDYIVAREGEFQVPLLSPEEAIRLAETNTGQKPIVLADVHDNCGTGGTSDTTGLLHALLREDVRDTVLGVMLDPETAAIAHEAGLGAEIDVEIGAKLYRVDNKPVVERFRVAALGAGTFECTGPFFGGLTAHMGPTALLQRGGVGVIVSTHRMQAADQAIFRHLGIELEKQRIICVKSAVHFRADFDSVAEKIILVDSPGAFVDRPEKIPYRNLRSGIRLCPNGPTRQ